MFDRLLLLARGKIIYFNEANKSVDYFNSLGHCCPELSNPCDYFMTMMSKESIEFDMDEAVDGEVVDAEKIEEEYKKLIDFFDDNYNRSTLQNNPDITHEDIRPVVKSDVVTQTSWCYQFNLLAKRNFLNLVRLPQTSYVKLITTCVTAGFAALLFWKAGALIPDTPVTTLNHLKLRT